MDRHAYLDQAGELILRSVGLPLTHGGLSETPARFARAMGELLSGYAVDPEAVLKTFAEDDVAGLEVIIADIPFTSLCEHHLLPFTGTAEVRIVYDRKPSHVVGLSKFARLVDALARRLQVQERLTIQIADTIQKVVQPWAVMVELKATHTCMCSRGARAVGSTTTTQCRRGKG